MGKCFNCGKWVDAYPWKSICKNCYNRKNVKRYENRKNWFDMK